MKLFSCSRCGSLVYFENSVCLSCSSPLGFDPASLALISLVKGNNPETFHAYGDESRFYRLCENHSYGTCNWLVPGDSRDPFCVACGLNRTIPHLSQENLERWRQIEVAKHRLVYALLRLGMSVKPRAKDAYHGIAFDFLADVSPEKRVVTGHNNGVITLNIEEADEAERVRNKLGPGGKIPDSAGALPP